VATAQELGSGTPSGLHGAHDTGRCGHRTQLLAAECIAMIAFGRTARDRSAGIRACPQPRSQPSLAGHDQSREDFGKDGFSGSSAGKDETSFPKSSCARARAKTNLGSGSAAFNSS